MSNPAASDVTGFDPAAYKPIPASGVELFDRAGNDREHRYVLVRKGSDETVVLSESDQALWDLIDGQSTVDEICTRYLERHRRLALTRAYSLLQRLLQRGFLTTEGLEGRFAPPTVDWAERVSLVNWFRIPLSGSQGLAGGLGRLFAPLRIDSLPVQIAIGIAIAVGLMLSTSVHGAARPLLQIWQDYPDVPLLGYVPASYVHGIALLLVLFFLASVMRELWRAGVECGFTGRPQPFELVANYGIPAIGYPSKWRITLPLRQRVTAGLAGVEFELLAATVCAVLAQVAGAGFWREVLFKSTYIFHLRALLHCSPFPSSDFAQVMEENLGVRGFRRRSVGFLRHNFIDALFGDAQLTREQGLYLTFNMVTALWLALVAKLGLDFLEANQQAFRDVTGPGMDTAEGAILRFVLLCCVAPVLVTFCVAVAWALYVLWAWGRQQKYLQAPPTVGIIGAVAIVLVTACVGGGVRLNLLTPATGELLFAIATGATCLGAIALFGRTTLQGMGSYLSRRHIWTSGALLAVGLATVWGHGGATIRCLPVLCLTLVAVAMVESVIWRQHLIQVSGTRLSLPEIFSTMGGLLLVGWAVNRGWCTAQVCPASVGMAMFAGSALFALGLVMVGLVFRQPPDPPGDDALVALRGSGSEALQNASAFIVDRIHGALLPVMGGAAVARLSQRMAVVCPNATLCIGGGGKTVELCGECLNALDTGIAAYYGRDYSDRFFDRIFRTVHWQAKGSLRNTLFRDTPWQQRFAVEETLDQATRRKLLDEILLFQELSPQQREKLVERTFVRKYAPGALLLRQGDVSGACFVLVSGRVQVEEQDISGETRILSFLHEGDFFGEAALLSDERRLASVRTALESVALIIHQRDFAAVLADSAETLSRVRDRLVTLRALLKTPVFADLPASILRNILPRIRTRTFTTGKNIVTKGERGEDFFLIKSGKVEVLAVEGESKEHICDLGPNDYFGEIALLRDIPRTATVRAISEQPTEVLVLAKSDFIQLTTHDRLFAANLATTGEERLQTTHTES